MSARFLPVSNTFIEVLLWLSDMAEWRDIARSAARHRECRRLPKKNYFAFKRATARGGKWSMISSTQVYDLPAIRQAVAGFKVLRYQSRTSDFNRWDSIAAPGGSSSYFQTGSA